MDARREFDSLEKWLYCEDATALGLRGIELGEELRGRQLMRLLLQAHVEHRGDGDVGAAIEVMQQDVPSTIRYTHKRMHVRNIMTIFGKVRIRRVGYGMVGKDSIHPLDEQLRLPARRYSHEVQRRLVKIAVQGPFDEAVEGLQEATGVRIPKRSAEEIVIDACRDFDSFYARRRGDRRRKTGAILVGSVDCKGIPMVKKEPAQKIVRRQKGQKANKKKMATVAAVFTQRPNIRTAQQVVESLFDPPLPQQRCRKRRKCGPERKRVWASLEAGKDAFIDDVNKEMNRRDPRKRKIRVVVTDGERGLQRRVGRIMKDVTLVLDFLHVLERLWACGHARYGEGSKEAREFVRLRALRILTGQVSQVVKGLRQIVTKRRLKGEKRKTLLATAGYYYRNRSRMQYHEYLRKGFPIASGAVEGACKNLIKDRMERSGMRWTSRMAEAMIKVRAAYLSGDFEDYWDYHVNQELERLYPDGRWRPLISVVLK